MPSVAYSVCLTSCAFSCAWSNLPLFEQQVLRVSLSLYWFFSMFARFLSVCRLHLLSSMIIKFVVCCWIVSCRKDEGSCTVAAAFSCVLQGLAEVSLLLLLVSFPCIDFPLIWCPMSDLHRKGLAESLLTTKRALQSLFYVGCCWRSLSIHFIPCLTLIMA